jgi:hypothetical protein
VFCAQRLGSALNLNIHFHLLVLDGAYLVVKRVLGIGIERCARCGGRLRVIASIEEPELIERILAHRRERGEEVASRASLGARAPPQASLF